VNTNTKYKLTQADPDLLHTAKTGLVHSPWHKDWTNALTLALGFV